MFFRIVFCLLILIVSCNAKIVTYTAYSKESQKKADEEAFAGVAKQISVKINVATYIKHAEIQRNNEIYTEKQMLSEKSLVSDLNLKGVELIQETKENDLYKATARIDLDKLTASIQQEIQKIQTSLFQKKQDFLKFLEKKKYKSAIELLGFFDSLKTQFDAYVKEHKIYAPLPKDLEIDKNFEEITNQLKTKLSDIQIQIENFQELSFDGKNPLSLKILVKDSKGIISDFPIFFERNGNIIEEIYSDKQGRVEFNISAKHLFGEPYRFNVGSILTYPFPEISAKINQTISYKYNVPNCIIELKCTENSFVCNEIAEGLSKKSDLTFKVKPNASLEAKVKIESKRTLNKLSSYDVSIEFKQENSFCSVSKLGVGKTEKDAVRNAVKKMNLKSCSSLLEFCKP